MPQFLTSNNANIILGYWGIRGLAQPIRFLLTCADVPFSEVRLGVFSDGTLMNKNQEEKDWHQLRATLNMPFPNLPYLIDSNHTPPVRLTQSNAILRYLARRYDFYGDSELERAEIDVLQDQAYDFRNEIIAAAYTPADGYSEMYDYFCKHTLPRYLDSFELCLASRGTQTYFVGQRLSMVDFVLYELLWQMTKMVPQSVSITQRPTLYGFIRHFETIPQIASYQRSDHFIIHPINSPWASFA